MFSPAEILSLAGSVCFYKWICSFFCAACARLIKISSVSCVRKGGCKWGRPPYCLPRHSLHLWERSSYFSPGSDSSIHSSLASCPSSVPSFPKSGCGCALCIEAPLHHHGYIMKEKQRCGGEKQPGSSQCGDSRKRDWQKRGWKKPRPPWNHFFWK